jgi:hypothetical protein
MKQLMREKIRGMAAATTAVAVSLVAIWAGIASAKKKEKAYLPDFVLKAKTVLVVIMPDAGEPIDERSANHKARKK